MPEPRGRPQAIVRPGAVGRTFDVARHAVRDARLVGLVDYLWVVRWDVAEPHDQQVVPQPVVHVVAEPVDEQLRVLVHGVSRSRFTRRLEGRGCAVGAAFRPGGFRPLLGRAVSTLADAVVPLGDLVDVDDRAVAARAVAADDDEGAVAVLEAALAPLVGAPDPAVDRVAGWVAAAERDVAVVRAEHLAERVGVSLRTLQRTFAEYVGIGPKWVIQRFRVLEALAAANDGAVTDWTALAVQLGFTDQSHLVNVFGDVIGTPPDTYQREVAGEG
ncbi:DUF6597 domain-containing transcriptional factor [Euzebya sp.]|uniref:AraC family transcriptional regulator n=1 Tax=Euzebya sp. TaxID=1971409 RepID=UPI0035111B53